MAELMNTVATVGIDDVESAMHGKFLTFSVQDEVFGIEIKYVTEILGIQEITVTPQLPSYIKGIVNMRGKIIPVMDMRLRFDLEPAEYNDRTCIIVIDINAITIGLIVDTVLEVVYINDEDVLDPPSSRTGFNHHYIKGLGRTSEGVKSILDCDKLFLPEEVAGLTGTEV